MTPPRTIGRLVSAVATEPRAALILSATPEPALPPDEIDHALRFALRSREAVCARAVALRNRAPVLSYGGHVVTGDDARALWARTSNGVLLK